MKIKILIVTHRNGMSVMHYRGNRMYTYIYVYYYIRTALLIKLIKYYTHTVNNQ